MLQSIREMAKSWIVKSFLILLLASFCVWGIGDMFRGNPQQREVATVGNVSIPVQVLEARFQASLPQLRQSYGPDLTAEQARAMGILEQTLNVMVEETTFTQEATRLGLNVPDAVILNRIVNEPRLKNEKGEFDKALWEQTLRRIGLTERAFVNQEREQSARNLIFMSILPNVKAPDIMVDSLYQARGAKRILDVVKLKNSSVRGVKSPSVSMLKAYYEESKANFIAPEYRGITVAKLTMASVEKDIEVSDADLKKAYDERTEELTEPEKRDLVQLVVQDKAKAEKLFAAAQKRGSLAKAAKSAGLTPISMKKINARSVLPVLRDALFALKKMETAKPIKSALGWHVMQVKRIHKGGLPPLAKVTKSLRKQLQEERAGDNLARLVNQWDDELAAGQSLEDIADMLKLRLTRFAGVDDKGLTPEGKEEKNIPAEEMILQSAFELNSDETGPVLEDGLGNYYVVRVDSVTLSQARPFDSVKKEVKAAWVHKKQSEVAAKKIAKMAEAMRDGKAARKFAAQRGVTVRVSKPISFLGDMDKNIPITAMNKVFQMKKGDVITASNDSNHYVLKLADIISVDLKKSGSSRIKVVDDVRASLPKNYIEEYALYLHELFPRHINANLLEQLKRQDSAL